MRIAFFLDQSFPPDPRVENEAISLIQEGHEVLLFSLDYRQLTPLLENINGIHVHRYHAGKMVYKLSALAYTNRWFQNCITRKLKHFIDSVQPEVLHVHDMVIAESVMDLNDKYYQLPVVLDLHENRPEIMQYYPHLKRGLAKVLVNIDRWRIKQKELIKRADHVVMVTDVAISEAAQENNLSRNHFVQVPNTIKADVYYEYGLQESVIQRFSGRFNVVYVGDTGLRRGTDTAIEAMKFLIDQIPEISLILVGKSTEDKVLKERVVELNISQHVQFEGWQDVSLFPSYIEAGDVCICPLHRNLHHDSTYANKLFQYMASGKPLVVSDCVAQANVVRELNCGLIFKAGNPVDLAEKLIYLKENPEHAKRLGENGRIGVKRKYNWKETSKELIELYDGPLLPFEKKVK